MKDLFNRAKGRTFAIKETKSQKFVYNSLFSRDFWQFRTIFRSFRFQSLNKKFFFIDFGES
jgi:hypothetical protein